VVFALILGTSYAFIAGTDSFGWGVEPGKPPLNMTMPFGHSAKILNGLPLFFLQPL